MADILKTTAQSSRARILFLSPYDDPAAGVSVFVRRLADGLRSRGRSVSVATFSAEPSPRGFRNAALIARSLATLWKGRHSYDIVHLQQLHPQTAAAGFLARALGARVVVTVHGRSPRPTGPRGILFDAAENIGRKIPDVIVFAAESLRDSMGPGIVIPNGVPTPTMRPGPESREGARRRLGLGDEFTLIFVGRVDRDKGFDVLLDALDRARSVWPSVRLIAVGPVDDDVRAAVSRERAEYVTLLGFQSNPAQYVAAADVFVLPSLREGLPLSLLEAMAMGLPVIGTRVGDIPRVVRPGDTGWLVDPGDISGLASAIIESAADAEHRKSMGSRAANLVSSRYDMGSVVWRYEALYAQVCGGGQQEP